MDNILRQFPAVHELLAAPSFVAIIEQYGRDNVVITLRLELDQLRHAAQQGNDVASSLTADHLAVVVKQHLIESTKPRLRSVINATGILLHTNLGRAPMAEVAVEAAAMAARGYLNLELDLVTGKRSSRPDAVRPWLTKLLGCESATVVNNNAAATVIVLRALARGKEVIVSRGQLVEIGGSFRIPEIMAVSGATLTEVGATNITRLSDYERAITENTALLLRVHASNYRVVGHAETPTISELVQLGKTRGIPVVDDIGSGALIDMSQWGLDDEPMPNDSLQAGADLVLFSGDKLLGGPQCGIIAGRADLIEKIERDPLMRAFRVDKMTLAALEATLRLYLDSENALEAIPHFKMLEIPLAVLQERAYLLARYLGNIPGLSVHVADTKAYVGGGTLPDRSVPSVALAIRSEHLSENELAQRLRMHEPAIMGRVEDGLVLLDLRTVPAEQDQAMLDAVQQVSLVASK
ncbi:MAG: L-seryl-tRNA(Sec) selenium transferase [Gemmatales bacterium]